MTNDVQELGPKGCPYLGLEEDRTVMLLEASPLHRCYSDPGAIEAPTVQYQADWCLCEKHVQCARLLRAVPVVEGSVSAPPRRQATQRRGGIAQYIIGALAVLLLLGAGTWVAMGFLAPKTQIAAAPTPTLSLTGASEAVAVEAQSELLPADSTDPPDAAANATSAASTPAPYANGTVENQAGSTAEAGNATMAATAADSANTGEDAKDTAAVIDNATSTPTGQISLFGLVTPTPVPGGQEVAVHPTIGAAGWWTDGDAVKANLNDSYLYSGALNGQNYIAGVRFDLKRVPRGAPILEGSLELTGLRDQQFDRSADASWLVQLIGANELDALTGANFMMLYSAPSAIMLLPQLTPQELGAGKANTWELDVNTLRWLEQQRIDGAESVIIRIVSSNAAGANTLFGWDSGLGATTSGNPPTLTLTLGPEPTATPPLPTREFIVATFTPALVSVVELAVFGQTATAVALTTGTYTPVPYFVTPTPLPQNLATVQAAAQLSGLPAVVPDTPEPGNAATATAVVDFATAVAKTTGTFTPVPTAYVTPFKVLPSPPADTLQTMVVRNAEATAAAANGAPTATPLPYNAVMAQYVVATITPGNVATAAALVAAETANAELTGTATPTPWEAVVITPTPVPVPPSPTPTPTLPVFIPEQDFTPTATPLPGSNEVIPDVLPAEFKNKIFFRTNRTGEDETFVMDPATGDAGKITRNWVYPLAGEGLAVAPDGKHVAKVMKGSTGVLQIFVHSLEYGTDKQITNFSRDSYDPAWSPTGEWIAFVSTEPGNDEVYRVSPDGAIVQRLTNNTYEWDKHPTWSPDGMQILFYSNRDTGRRQLWIMNADGGGQRNFSGDEFEDRDPVWTRERAPAGDIGLHNSSA